MQLLASRTYPYIDFESLEEHQARDSLFRTDNDAFVLHFERRRPSGMAQLPFRVDMDQ